MTSLRRSCELRLEVGVSADFFDGLAVWRPPRNALPGPWPSHTNELAISTLVTAHPDA